MTRFASARIGLACGVAALTFGAGNGARAEEGVAFKNLMANMGILSPERDPIRYRERAPLVLPPKAQLPEPMTGGLAASNPAWPKDPDVETKKRRAAEERTPVTYSETRRMSENNPRLTVEEMRGGRNPSAANAPDPKLHRGDSARDQLYLTPDQLRSTAKRSDDDDAKLAAGEPQRRTLTEPPSGMRKSATGGRIAASNAAPHIDQQQADANPINWLTRKFQSSDDE
jgi:hypothetical protein